MGDETTISTQGTVESILLARAISIAAAEKGLAKNRDGFGAAGEPGRMEDGVLRSGKRVGERRGELKERR